MPVHFESGQEIELELSGGKFKGTIIGLHDAEKHEWVFQLTEEKVASEADVQEARAVLAVLARRKKLGAKADMGKVLINVNASGNEKSIPVEILTSKKIKSMAINFDENRVDVTYEGESNAREDIAREVDNVGPGEEEQSAPVNETAQVAVEDVEELDKPDASVTVELSGDGNEVKEAHEAEDKRAAKNADGDLGGDTSTTEGSDAGAKKTNRVVNATKKSGDKTN